MSDSFPQEVWQALASIDVDAYIEKKGAGNRQFSYLPWAAAWECLMGWYPESSFEFDEPRFWENGTGEQWITVTIRDGDREMQRRWWLPYLDYANKPVTSPTALQINNTRMRVLVKALAMCGLGTHLYMGEDVPDQKHDSAPTGARAASLEGVKFTDKEQAQIFEWVAEIKGAMPTKDDIDFNRVKEFYLATRKLGDMTIAIYDRLESWRRTEIFKVRKDVQEQERLEATTAPPQGETDAP